MIAGLYACMDSQSLQRGRKQNLFFRAYLPAMQLTRKFNEFVTVEGS